MNTLIIISCICMLFVIGRIFIVPIKWILKLVFNSILGGVIIWIINMIGGVWGFHIGLNIYTSILVRFFRDTRGNFFNIIKINYWNINKRKPTPIVQEWVRMVRTTECLLPKSYRFLSLQIHR